MTTASQILDRVLVLEMVRVTEAAAIAAAKLIGRGDEKAADAAAVEAMRAALNELYMDGTVVIGEGERDEAPMLFIGEKVGSAIGTGPKIDIALDPLEGTTITAKAGPNALAVLAVAEEGNLLNAPDVYMDKIAIGPGYSPNIVNLDKTVAENVNAVAKEKGVAPDELIVCVLDRPRHEKLIAELRALGCGVMLIPDGDVAGVIATTNPDTTVDIYMGSGGAPEGVLAAAACAVSAASSRAACCSATTMNGRARANGELRISTRFTIWKSSQKVTAFLQRLVSPTVRCSLASKLYAMAGSLQKPS